MPSTGWGAGRRTDRFSDGIKPLQLRERPPAAVPLLPLYRKTRAGVDYFIGGGAGPACMKDLVVEGFVKLLRLRRASGKGVSLPSPTANKKNKSPSRATTPAARLPSATRWSPVSLGCACACPVPHGY